MFKVVVDNKNCILFWNNQYNDIIFSPQRKKFSEPGILLKEI